MGDDRRDPEPPDLSTDAEATAAPESGVGRPDDAEDPARARARLPHAAAPLRRISGRGLRHRTAPTPDDDVPPLPPADDVPPPPPADDVPPPPPADDESPPDDATAPIARPVLVGAGAPATADAPETVAPESVRPGTVPMRARPATRPVEAPPVPPAAPPPAPAADPPAPAAPAPTGLAAAPAAPPPAPPTPAPPSPAASPRRTRVAAADKDFAATATVLAALRARLPRRRPWTWPRAARAAAGTAAVLVVLVNGLAWGATSWVEAAIRQIGALDPSSSSIVDAQAQVGDQNFLVVGSDTRIGAVPSEEVGSADDIPGARSDTVMVVHVPADNSRVSVVSFPRDLEIDRPACRRWDPVSGQYSDQVVPPTSRVKLNTAYQAGGPLCVTKVVQQLSGLAVNHFLGIDFQGFKEMVDAVDGVSICIDRPIRDSVLGTIVDRAGPTVLTGDQALAFVRARHVEGDPTSDYGRIQRQQRFLGALLRETLSAGTLLDVRRLRGLVDAVGRSTFGENVAADQLLVLGRSLGSVDPGAVTFTSVPTTGFANSRGNEVLRPAEDRALFGAIIRNAPLPGQPGAASTAVPPDQVVLRLARTGDAEDDSGSRAAIRSGVTQEVATALRAQGIVVVLDPTAAEPDTTPRSEDGNNSDGSSGSGSGSGTVIRFTPDRAGAAATLARSVPRAVMSPVDGIGQLALSLSTDVDDADGFVVAPSPVVPDAAAPVITAADPSCA